MSLSQFFTLRTSCVSLTGHRSRPGEPRKLTAKLWLAALFLPLGFLWVRDPRYTDFRLKESTSLSLGKTEGGLFINHTLSSNKCVCLLRNFKRSMKTKAPSRMNAVLVLDVQDIKKLTVSHALCEKVWSCAPCMRVRAQRCPTLREPMDCSRQAPLSMGFPRQEYWSGLPFPPPGDPPNPGIEPVSLVSLTGRLILCHWCHTVYAQIKSQDTDTTTPPYVFKAENSRGPGINSLQQSLGVARGHWGVLWVSGHETLCPMAHVEIPSPDWSFSRSLRPG